MPSPRPSLREAPAEANRERFHAADLTAWRTWLEMHHATERVVWLLFDKGNRSGCIAYDDALDEALCWGWIDSIVRRIDDATYARKFTRRTNSAKWSHVNIVRLKRLLEAGRVQAAGRAAISEEVMRKVLGETPIEAPAKRTPVPAELTRALAANAKAKAFFDSLAPSYRRNYIGWVADGKQAQTRERRAQEAARLLAQGQKGLLK